MMMHLLATTALAAVLVPADTPMAHKAAADLNALWMLQHVLFILLPAYLFFSGRAARMSALVTRWLPNRPWLAAMLFSACVIGLLGLLMSPYDFLRHYVMPHRLGIDDQPFSSWLTEEATGLLINTVVIAVVAWVPLALARRTRHWWWLAAVLLMPLAMVLLVAKPIFIDPLTTSYRPLDDKGLIEEIDELVRRCGGHRVPIMVGGDDTSVVGFGPSMRVVLEENLKRKETPAQVRFTIAHELKHYIEGDEWRAVGCIALLLLGGAIAFRGLGGLILRRFGVVAGCDSFRSPAAIVLMLFVTAIWWTAASPIFLWYSRYVELEADRFGLELTHENDAAAAMFASWAGPAELARPGLLEYRLRMSHPSIAERIMFANEYKPWATGQSLKYAGVCSMASEDTQ